MSDVRSPQTPRLWPGVVIVVAQLVAMHVPGYFAPSSPLMFFSMLGSITIGPLLFFVWWLGFSRAAWPDRLGGLALLLGVHTLTVVLAHSSAKMVALAPGLPWLFAVFVATLFFSRRALTVAAVLVASLSWTLVRTDGVSGAMHADYAWRFSSTAEERFLASEASQAPTGLATAGVVEAAAWPGFRGASRDSVLTDVTIPEDWAASPPQQLWKRPVGPGWGSFALVGERLCTQEQRDDDEVVVCYRASDGEPLWIHRDTARFWEALGGAGPRATPTYHQGMLYTLGATGILNCLDASTGAPAWTRNIATDSGAEIPDWGFASSPLIVEDLGLVVVHAAGAPDGRAVLAYDLTSGEPRWQGQASGASYSSPHLTTLAGVRQIVMLTGDGAFGLEPSSGELLWRHDWPMGGGGSRVVQPTVLEGGSGILLGTSFGMGTRRVSVTADGPGTLSAAEDWTSRGLKPYYNDLVIHDGVAFGFDGNILAAIDLSTGERRWKGGRYGNGQMLLLAAQDLLIVISERGDLALVRASAERFEEVARFTALEGKTWNHPAVADGVIYVRNDQEMAAYRLGS